jgi:cyclopropane fatty-acyl-phospholipid synthase-like methyltransferase
MTLTNTEIPSAGIGGTGTGNTGTLSTKKLLGTLPFSQACENNKGAILPLLQLHLSNAKQLLEIGSGTGQHCVYFAKHLQLDWQPSDQADYIPNLAQRILLTGSANILPPLVLEITASQSQPWSIQPTNMDAIFSANTLHIMSKSHVEAFFKGAKASLTQQGQVFIYGPFNYQGEYSSPSNQDFDALLKDRDPNSGIRDIEWITQLANAHGLSLVNDYAMPANNRLLHLGCI